MKTLLLVINQLQASIIGDVNLYSAKLVLYFENLAWFTRKVKSTLFFHVFSASGSDSNAMSCKNEPFTGANLSVYLKINRQVRNQQKCLKNSCIGVEKLIFSFGLALILSGRTGLKQKKFLTPASVPAPSDFPGSREPSGRQRHGIDDSTPPHKSLNGKRVRIIHTNCKPICSGETSSTRAFTGHSRHATYAYS